MIRAVDFIESLWYIMLAGGRKEAPAIHELQAPGPPGLLKNIGGLIMYYYILGCGVACLVLAGINSMDTVMCVKPAEILVKSLLWPITLVEALMSNHSMNRNFKAAL